VYPLAVAQVEGDLQNAADPQWDFPIPGWSGLPGFDEIQSKHFVRAQRQAVVLHAPDAQPEKPPPTSETLNS